MTQMQKCQYLYEKLTRKAYAGNMKSEIKYNAAGDALETIGRWQDWLKSERGYSEHTLDAYFRDLSAFFAFFERPLTLAKLGRLDVRDFRAYLASRAAKHLEKSSIAREVSAVKNFSNGWTATILLRIRQSASYLRRGSQKFCPRRWILTTLLTFSDGRLKCKTPRIPAMHTG